MTLITGFKSPEDVLFKEDMKVWEKTMNLILTVDTAKEGYEVLKELIETDEGSLYLAKLLWWTTSAQLANLTKFSTKHCLMKMHPAI